MAQARRPDGTVPTRTHAIASEFISVGSCLIWRNSFALLSRREKD
jgi:hypothetical protein